MISISQILTLSLIVAFYVQAVWICFQEDMIFEWAGNFLSMNLPDFMQKPVYDCPICMTPWHGALFLFAIRSIIKPGIFISGVILLVAMGINVTITKLWRHCDD